ncbi:hypothetical protein [Streptomyces atratus]
MLRREAARGDLPLGRCTLLLTPAPGARPNELGGLAALACVACCALPVDRGGRRRCRHRAVVGLLPGLAVVLALLAAGTWWLGQRRRSCTCAPKTAGEGGCGCKACCDPLKITGAGRR